MKKLTKFKELMATIKDTAIDYVSGLVSDWRAFYNAHPFWGALLLTSTMLYWLISWCFNFMNKEGYDFEWIERK